jgi:hypothetical protein
LSHSRDFQLAPVGLAQHDATGSPQATYDTRRIVTRPAKLFLSLLIVTKAHPSLFSEGFENKIVFTISSAALHTSATHAIDFKTLLQTVSFPGKNCVRYKVLREQILDNM